MPGMQKPVTITYLGRVKRGRGMASHIKRAVISFWVTGHPLPFPLFLPCSTPPQFALWFQGTWKVVWGENICFCPSTAADGFPCRVQPVAAQHEVPFTQVLAPERKLSQQTGGPGWYSCLWLGSVFLHSGEEMDGQWLHPYCLFNLDQKEKKKKSVRVSCYYRFLCTGV